MTRNDWLDHDGEIVILDGVKHRLRVDVYRAVYPYPHDVLKVWATPVNPDSKYYREVRSQLGDDWSTDLLESDVEVQADVICQLGGC